MNIPEGCAQQTDETSTAFHHAELSRTHMKSEKCNGNVPKLRISMKTDCNAQAEYRTQNIYNLIWDS